MRTKFRIGYLALIVGLSSFAAWGQDSGPDQKLIRDGYITESYNLRKTLSGLVGASASASVRITIPQSHFILRTSAIASFAFSSSATPTAGAAWEPIPANFDLNQKFEKASGTYLFIRAGTSAVNYYYYAIGRTK